ncbi:MAG: hypothetical protein K6E33_00950 [Lachnospiraceae bacterium]|nr:hypothetical protein [Lachnospiraceae bacterium]
MKKDTEKNEEEIKKELEEAKIPRDEMKKVAGSGTFDDVPVVEEHPYDNGVTDNI